MNILHVIDTTGPGGAETLFVELCKSLQEKGHRCYAVLRGDGWVYQQLKKAGIETYIHDCKGAFNVRFLFFLVRLLRQKNIDVVQSHLLGSNVYSALAGLMASVPVIATFHGSVDVSSNERWLSIKFAAVNRCASIVCVSELLRENLIGRTSVDAEKITLIKNGIDCDHFSPVNQGNLREQYCLPGDVFIVGALGNLRPAKDYPTAIRAMQLVVAQDPSVHLLIAGDTKHTLYTELSALVDELDLNRNVRFVGFCDRPSEFLAGIDLYMLASKTEGHPFSVIQAMASGKAVLATRCGVETMFLDDGGAVLVDVGSAAQLAEKTLELKRSPWLREALGAAGRKNALKNYDFAVTVKRYIQLYEAAVK